MIVEDAFGLGLAPEKYDVLMAKHADKKMRAIEADLMTSKWFDYRFLHPVAATYLYAYHYKEQYKAAFGRYFDARQVHRAKTLKKHYDLFLNSAADITAIWRGRQAADALGVPYNLYIRWAIDARMNYWQRGSLPLASHLYSQLVTDKVPEKWDDYRNGFLMLGEHEAYHSVNYSGLPMQDEHVDWVIEQARKQPSVLFALQAAYRRGVITPDQIATKYNAVVATKVAAIAA